MRDRHIERYDGADEHERVYFRATTEVRIGDDHEIDIGLRYRPDGVTTPGNPGHRM